MAPRYRILQIHKFDYIFRQFILIINLIKYLFDSKLTVVYAEYSKVTSIELNFAG